MRLTKPEVYANDQCMQNRNHTNRNIRTRWVAGKVFMELASIEHNVVKNVKYGRLNSSDSVPVRSDLPSCATINDTTTYVMILANHTSGWKTSIMLRHMAIVSAIGTIQVVSSC